MVDKEKLTGARKNVSEGIVLLAKAYGLKGVNTAMQRAIGLNSLTALTNIVKRGGAEDDTMDLIINRTGVGRSWLFDRVGEMFPKGKKADFGVDKSGSSVKVDVDVLRNLVSVLAASLAANVPGADATLYSGIDAIEYSDRGFLDDLKETIGKAAEAGRAVSGSPARPAVGARGKQRRE